MEQMDFIRECRRIFDVNRLPCTEAQARQLFRLTARMLEVNQHMNLTAITDEKAVILRHYVDSCAIAAYIPQGARVIDVGCGAGFPTLPLAIARPDLQITALDGTAKRIAYVRDTAELLGLDNVTVVAGRAEEYAVNPAYREKFDVVTARAVAGLPVLSELCLPFARVDGKMIAMKSQRVEEELREAENAISLCGGGAVEVCFSDITENGVEFERRALVLIEKRKNTPKIYPRHFSKISKKPL